MYFKRLQMVGFKSFLNKTTCKFEPGVTAIVGPNGCGKSNIVDSIKWVFGEQSAKSMRSSSMQDVIFNGTEKQEAVNVAEVSITLSNEDKVLPVDFEEVTITRRLFRSGESEYLINKTQVRLMDVRNLLMGTGLGTSAYSVIEQGKMDMILSSKPEERRYVFEEASGITRYRTKKREAVLKLERTQENLTRLNDIIREVERQIKAIERQARKADRYKACFEEMKALDVKLSKFKFDGLSVDNNRMDTEAQARLKVTEELKMTIASITEEMVEQRREYDKLMEDLQSTQEGVIRISSDIDKNSHIIIVNEERARELEKYAQRLDWEIEEATNRKESLLKRIEDLGARYKETADRRIGVEAEVAGFEEKIRSIEEGIQKYQHDLQLSKDKTLDITSEQMRFRNDLVRLKADMQNCINRENRLVSDKKSREREAEAFEARLRETEAKVAEVRGELEAKRSEFEFINNEMMSKQQSLNSLREDKFSRERKLHQISPRIEFLEKLIAEREGMRSSVKDMTEFLESRKGEFPGVHGVLSELITIQEGYGESLESLLGDYSQAIVVDSRDDADRLIKVVEGRALDSVSFIILDEAEEVYSEGQAADPSGAIKHITSIMLAKDPSCKGLAGVLNKIFVSASSGEAKERIKEDAFSGYILCEKGEIFQRGRHRSRNYSDKEVVSLFGRQKKLEEMKNERSAIASEIENVDSQIGSIEMWLKGNASKKTELEDNLNKRRIEYIDISSKQESIKEKMAVLLDEVSLIDVELREVRSSAEEMKAESAMASERLACLEKETVEVEHKIEFFTGSISDTTAEREKTFHSLSNSKAELSAIKKEEEHLADSLSREKENMENVGKDVDEKREQIEESSCKIKAFREESRALVAKNNELSSLKEKGIFEGAQKKGQKDRLSGLISVKEKDLREKENELESVRDQARDLDIKLKELEYKREALVQKVYDTYKVDIRKITATEDSEFDLASAEGQVGELRDRIEKMGAVSLGAVEEHKELEERFAFLTKQRDDLVSSREDIMKAIARINRTTRKLFMDTFEVVRTEFSHYFKVLFNGGKAELVLEDETNVLECGIDIVVRPPGKKLQNIMLLSGGEKAMTAIALIFALFKVNPSPFCILDEIDAPLDESNVVRFSTILKEFLKTSQFIIITHNRMTIQLAGVLYGITMQEKGVSKVVSVKFSEKDKLKELQEEPVAV